MKDKRPLSSGVQDICRKLKLQLEELSLSMETLDKSMPSEDETRRHKLMEQLKRQLADLS